MHTISITEALAPRMALIAQAMAERVDPGEWEGYRATEPLVGRYTKPPGLGGAPTVDYHRASRPNATIAMGFLAMIDIEEIERGPISVSEDIVEEKETIDVEFRHPIHYSKTISHEFEKTQSYAEAAKQAWEVAAKASLSVEYAGIKGALEASAKYGQELNQQSSQSQTERDRITTLLEFTGPASFRLEAYRSRNRESRVVKARADFDGKIYWQTGSTAWEFTTFKTEFVPIAKRIADDGIYGYEEFMNRPMSDAEIGAIEAPSGKFIEFPVVYDNILVQSLKEV